MRRVSIDCRRPHGRKRCSARGCIQLGVAAGNGQSQSLDREGPIELRRECLFDALFGGVVVLDAVGDRSEFGELFEAKCSRDGLTVARHDDFAGFDLGEEAREGVSASS